MRLSGSKQPEIKYSFPAALASLDPRPLVPPGLHSRCPVRAQTFHLRGFRHYPGMRLPSTWNLPEQIVARLGTRGQGKQRAMFAEGHLLLILHKAPSADALDREIVLFWREPSGAWHSSDNGKGVRALLEHLEGYVRRDEAMEKRFKSAALSADYFALLQEAAPLMRASRNMHEALQAAREAVPGDGDLIDLRDWAGNLYRNFELLYTDSKNGLDYAIARKAEEQTEIEAQSLRTADRLNVMAALFFPLTAIASVFGMQLHHGLENTSAWLFWLVFLIGIALGFVMRAWVLAARRPGR